MSNIWTIRKDGTGDFTSIAAWHNDARVQPGDIGEITDSGTYNEQVTITKANLTLRAATGAAPTWSYSGGCAMASVDFRVQGLRLGGSGNYPWARIDGSGVTLRIEDCVVVSNLGQLISGNVNGAWSVLVSRVTTDGTSNVGILVDCGLGTNHSVTLQDCGCSVGTVVRGDAFHGGIYRCRFRNLNYLTASQSGAPSADGNWSVECCLVEGAAAAESLLGKLPPTNSGHVVRVVNNTAVGNATQRAVWGVSYNNGNRLGTYLVQNNIVVNATYGFEVSQGYNTAWQVTTPFPNGAQTGDITRDPLFVGGGDYHLSNDSPERDSGTDTGASPDLDGNVRPIGNGWDRGAYEFALFATVSGANPETSRKTIVNFEFDGQPAKMLGNSDFFNVGNYTISSGSGVQPTVFRIDGIWNPAGGYLGAIVWHSKLTGNVQYRITVNPVLRTTDGWSLSSSENYADFLSVQDLPFVVSAESLSAKSLLVTFSEKMYGDDLTSPAAWSLEVVGGSSVDISSVVRVADRTVKVSTGPTSGLTRGTTYRVTAPSTLYDEGNNLIDPSRRSAEFVAHGVSVLELVGPAEAVLYLLNLRPDFERTFYTWCDVRVRDYPRDDDGRRLDGEPPYFDVYPLGVGSGEAEKWEDCEPRWKSNPNAEVVSGKYAGTVTRLGSGDRAPDSKKYPKNLPS